MTAFLWMIVIILFVLAFVGLIVPMLPDGLFLLAGFILYHFFIDSGTLTTSFWWAAGIVTALVIAADYIASALGAQKYGASKWSMASATVGVILFPLFLGPLGILVGPFVMVVLTEMLLGKSFEAGLKTGFGTLIGFLGGIFVKALLMAGLIVWFFILVI